MSAQLKDSYIIAAVRTPVGKARAVYFAMYGLMTCLLMLLKAR